MAQYLSKEGADNLSSAIRAYIDSTHSTSLLKTQLGAANGVAPLGSDKLIPSSYLPSYVDDVTEVSNYASLPSSGESGKIYVTLDDGKTYRWGGTAYVEISASLAIGEDASTAFAGNRGKAIEDRFFNTILKVGNGGTGIGSYAVGDMLYATGTTTLAKVSSSSFGRSLLGATSGTKFTGLYAEKAEKDSQGNVITSTYMPFTGGTFTGKVTHQDHLTIVNSKAIVSKSSDGKDVSLIAFNGNNDFVIGYGTRSTYDTLLYGNNIRVISGSGADALKVDTNNDTTAYGNIYGQKGIAAKGIADFGISGGGSTGGGTSYTLNIVPSTNKVSIQLKGGDGTSDTKDLAIFSTTQAGVVPNSPSTSSILRGNGWGTLAFSELTGKPTTLSGYGITDAKIANGIITIGSNTITPIVSSNLKTLTFAEGAFSAGSYTPTTAKTINVPTTTSHISEDGNLYFTNARAQAAITGGASTIVTSNLTASRALISNSSGKVAVSDITSTELSYLDGVSSNIQTQLNAKFPTANFTKANIKSTLGISDWALASSKPSYSATDISNLSLSVDTAYDWDTTDEIDSQSYGYSLTVGSKSFAMSAMTKTEVNAIISKYFA